MKIRVRDVVAGGIQLEFVVKPVDIGLETEEFLDPDKPLKVAVDLQKFDDSLIAQADVAYVREDHCARCLKHLSREQTARYELDFALSPGDEWIDLGGRIREEMIMGDAPRRLCREDCRGICPDCGADLNTEPCECEAPHDGAKKKKRSQ